ncbi:MAG: hypothetical protein IPM91_19710 [Bacteroidetes bacterium]|nr:hypothetical protein [Bacteroidota bacterium]
MKAKTINDSPVTGTIYIDNISEKDAQKCQIRIKVANKYIFPNEQPGNPKTYSLNFNHNNSEFTASYSIGSKDGKSRSGVLKFGHYEYTGLLNIKEGSDLKITKLSENKYTI